MINEFLKLRSAILVGSFLGICGVMPAQIGQLNLIESQPAVGSWLGRAIPIPSTTSCTVGTPTCPIPSEIIMLFTIEQGGTFIAIDSNIFKGANHTTAHGQWVSRSYGNVHATFSLLQQGPNGIFLGGFKNLFDGAMSDFNHMSGTLHAFLYLYTDANGNVIVGPDGLPSPNPLTNPTQCATTLPANSCSHLADFSFVAQRIQVEDIPGVD